MDPVQGGLTEPLSLLLLSIPFTALLLTPLLVRVHRQRSHRCPLCSWLGPGAAGGQLSAAATGCLDRSQVLARGATGCRGNNTTNRWDRGGQWGSRGRGAEAEVTSQSMGGRGRERGDRERLERGFLISTI